MRRGEEVVVEDGALALVNVFAGVELDFLLPPVSLLNCLLYHVDFLATLSHSFGIGPINTLLAV